MWNGDIITQAEPDGFAKDILPENDDWGDFKARPSWERLEWRVSNGIKTSPIPYNSNPLLPRKDQLKAPVNYLPESIYGKKDVITNVCGVYEVYDVDER